ncbi:MAG: HAD family hydrolase [Ignavibacteriales bacterium]|nr:HAD family hydrolase [Ignavibacteriales bacterium]
MSSPALFLDRDGTINFDSGYIDQPNKIIIYSDAPNNLYRIKKEFEMKLIVISNQAGVAKGFMTEKDVCSVNSRVRELLKKENVIIDDFFYCIHHPDFSSPEDSKCRKPSPQMIFEAQKKHNIDLSKSYFVGDKASDVECGINAGIKPCFILRENNSGELLVLEKQKKMPNFVAKNFNEIYEFIKNDLR